MQGTIEKIEQRKTIKQEPFWVVAIGGHKFSLFDQEIGNNFSEGDLVEFSWSENGRFKKIRSLTKVKGAA